MPHVQRDSNGMIVAVSRDAQDGFREQLFEDDPDLLAFLQSVGGSDLARSDLEFVRVLEDLLDVLMSKNVLLFTDLPAEAQEKILRRQALRRRGDSLDLLDDTTAV